MGRLAALIELSEKERGELEGLSRRRRTAQGLAQRAQIVLLAADGLENKAIAERAGAVENTVGKWRRRFAEKRLDGLLDEPRAGRRREIGDDEIAETVRLTLETTPKGATHWSLRSMAEAVDHAPSTIHRIWRAFGLQPHRAESFKLSTDPLFVEKVRDIVGLYMAPPEHALVLCVDEKSQIQALDRSQPVLPMRPGQIERRSHDYTRHGVYRRDCVARSDPGASATPAGYDRAPESGSSRRRTGPAHARAAPCKARQYRVPSPRTGDRSKA